MNIQQKIKLIKAADRVWQSNKIREAQLSYRQARISERLSKTQLSSR